MRYALIPKYYKKNECSTNARFVNFMNSVWINFDKFSLKTNYTNMIEMDYLDTKLLYLELMFRGFKINDYIASFFYDIRHVDENSMIIIAPKTKTNFLNIDFKKFGLKNIIIDYDIKSDYFFNNVPLEGFRVLNPNINIDKLKDAFLENGFSFKTKEEIIVEYKSRKVLVYNGHESLSILKKTLKCIETIDFLLSEGFTSIDSYIDETSKNLIDSYVSDNLIKEEDIKLINNEIIKMLKEEIPMDYTGLDFLNLDFKDSLFRSLSISYISDSFISFGVENILNDEIRTVGNLIDSYPSLVIDENFKIKDTVINQLKLVIEQKKNKQKKQSIYSYEELLNNDYFDIILNEETPHEYADKRSVFDMITLREFFKPIPAYDDMMVKRDKFSIINNYFFNILNGIIDVIYLQNRKKVKKIVFRTDGEAYKDITGCILIDTNVLDDFYIDDLDLPVNYLFYPKLLSRRNANFESYDSSILNEFLSSSYATPEERTSIRYKDKEISFEELLKDKNISIYLTHIYSLKPFIKPAIIKQMLPQKIFLFGAFLLNLDKQRKDITDFYNIIKDKYPVNRKSILEQYKKEEQSW